MQQLAAETIQDISTLKRFIFFLPQNAPKCVWWPGSAQTRGGAYSAATDPIASLKGKEGEEKQGAGLKGKNPLPMSEMR